MVLCGCTTDAINVSEGALAEDVHYQLLISSRDGEKAVFSPLDEKVVLSVRFDFNYRASYEWYKVEWIEPSGRPYKVVSTRTEFGSHRDLKAELKIRGKMAAGIPGLWRVRLSHLGREGEPDRLLISRLFRIQEMTPAMRASLQIDAPGDGQRPLAGHLPDEPLPPAAVGQPLVGETGLHVGSSSISTSEISPPASAMPAPARALDRRWPGCPPLYYPPGEGCVEQAPQE